MRHTGFGIGIGLVMCTQTHTHTRTSSRLILSVKEYIDPSHELCVLFLSLMMECRKITALDGMLLYHHACRTENSTVSDKGFERDD